MSSSLFNKILIANRGEIAVRIIRACRDLGISPVAVYSDVDAAAPHVRLADEAFRVGPAPSVESYLRIDHILDAARQCHADAIHPGYGFLSENPDFARATVAAGITFIGPGADAIAAMGSKTSARRLAEEAGVPVVPGTITPLNSHAEALGIARELGFPVMLKAAAGGGGKGMRLVRTADEMQAAFETARAEALSSFGNAEVYLEKAVERPRHIEIQIFADQHGNYVHLGERECSIQRRHQKVVEECPSPINDESLRQAMGAAAIKAARAVSYLGAGTVEFLVAGETLDFYFLEMNTRLQVEHPVTEMVTGIDMVREQITVAAGEPLSFSQEDVRWHGHAIECRVYAEDPDNGFLPSPGNIERLKVPSGPGIRNDGGVARGSEVSIYYDPLISKLVAWGRTRTEAIERMRRALNEYTVGGIKTTIPFFRELLCDPEFIAGRLDTGLIAEFLKRRSANSRDGAGTESSVESDIALIAAALAYRRQQSDLRRLSSGSHPSDESRWRLSGRIGANAGRF